MRELMTPPDPPKRPIGFINPEDKRKKGSGSARSMTLPSARSFGLPLERQAPFNPGRRDTRQDKHRHDKWRREERAVLVQSCDHAEHARSHNYGNREEGRVLQSSEQVHYFPASQSSHLVVVTLVTALQPT